MKDEVMEMKKELQEIKEESFAKELLKDMRKTNKRQFIIILVILVMWFLTGMYLCYVLNDIGTEEIVEEATTTTEYNQDISNEGNIENSNIINGGDINGEDKTNSKENNN